MVMRNLVMTNLASSQFALQRCGERVQADGLHPLQHPQAVGVQQCGWVPASQHTGDLFDEPLDAPEATAAQT